MRLYTRLLQLRNAAFHVLIIDKYALISTLNLAVLQFLLFVEESVSIYCIFPCELRCKHNLELVH